MERRGRLHTTPAAVRLLAVGSVVVAVLTASGCVSTCMRTERRDGAIVMMAPSEVPTSVGVAWLRDLAPSDSAQVCGELADWLAAEVVPLGVAVKPDETRVACTAPGVSDVAVGTAMTDILDGAKSPMVTTADGRAGRWTVSVLTAAGQPDAGSVTRRELYVALGFEAE